MLKIKGLPGLSIKIILSSLVLILFCLFMIVIFAWRHQNANVLTLSSKQNKFKINFDINNRDQEKFSMILGKLNFPQSVKKGVEFELEATPQARLVFITPIRVFFEILPKKINFHGSSYTSFSREYQLENIKIPTSTNLAVFGPGFNDFIKARFKLPDDFSAWLDQNFNSGNGQYLIIFGSSADFVIICKSDGIDLGSLKNIQSVSSEESLYKEESQDSVAFYLLKLPQDEENRQLTATFFQMGNWTYFSSSYESAQEVLKMKEGKNPSINFPFKNQGKPASLMVFLENTDKNPLNDKFFNLVFADQKSFDQTLKNIDKLEFTLKAEEFSGLINLK